MAPTGLKLQKRKNLEKGIFQAGKEVLGRGQKHCKKDLKRIFSDKLKENSNKGQTHHNQKKFFKRKNPTAQHLRNLKKMPQMGHLLGKTKTMKNLRQIETITKTIAMANKASRLTMKVAKESINRLIRTISKLCRRAAGRKITLCLAEATKISRMNLA